MDQLEEEESQDVSKMSGIDWSIFKDGEDDAFGWLLRTNMGLSSAEITRTTTPVDGSSMEALGLDEITMEPNGLLGMSTAIGSTSSAISNVMSAALASPGAISPDSLSGVTSMNDLASRLLQKDTSTTSNKQQTSNQTAAPANTSGKSRKVAAGGGGVTTRSKRKLSQSRSRSRSKSESADDSDLFDQEDAEDKVAAQEEEDEEMEKKRIRRLKNLESVREFRKRKMKQLEQNEAKLKRLEAENLDLKMRLKIGKEALRSEQQEKNQIKQQLKEMLQHKAPEKEIGRFLEMYRINYSDYGPKRREKLKFHLSRIRELLLPTEVTKICLNSVDQGIETVVNTESMGGKASSLWAILAKELEVSEEQQAEILKKRSMIKQLRADLSYSLDILNRLEKVTEEKNTALETAVVLLQGILTPTQSSKFILWVKNNPAFMYMLDRLVDISLMAPNAKK